MRTTSRLQCSSTLALRNIGCDIMISCSCVQSLASMFLPPPSLPHFLRFALFIAILRQSAVVHAVAIHCCMMMFLVHHVPLFSLSTPRTGRHCPSVPLRNSRSHAAPRYPPTLPRCFPPLFPSQRRPQPGPVRHHHGRVRALDDEGGQRQGVRGEQRVREIKRGNECAGRNARGSATTHPPARKGRVRCTAWPAPLGVAAMAGAEAHEERRVRMHSRPAR